MTALRLVTAGAADTDDPDLVEYLRWGRELRGLSKETLRVRRGVLLRLSEVAGTPLRHVTREDLQSWERHILPGKAPETRNAYVSHVSAFYGWAVLQRIIRDDPTVLLTRPKIPQALPRPIDDEDLRLALEAAKPKLAAMLTLMAFAGLRCMEVAGLTWSDLRLGDRPAVVVRQTKGGRERVVPIGHVVLAALERHGRRRNGPMFYGREAGFLTPSSVSQMVNGHLQRVGIDATAHQLRHRYATTAYQATTDIRLVQEMLGHRSPETTARYAAYSKQHAAEMVRKLDEQWTGAAADPGAGIG